MVSVIEKQVSNSALMDLHRKKIIDEILGKYQGLPGSLMIILNELQSQVGFISNEMQEVVAHHLRIPVSSVHGVVTFYSFFTTTPRGRHTIKFCMGTACYVGGTPQLIEKATQSMGIPPGKTTPDGNVTMELCRCVGACSQAPVIVVDEEIHGRVKPNKLPKILNALMENDGSSQ